MLTKPKSIPNHTEPHRNGKEPNTFQKHIEKWLVFFLFLSGQNEKNIRTKLYEKSSTNKCHMMHTVNGTVVHILKHFLVKWMRLNAFYSIEHCTKIGPNITKMFI